MPCLGKPNVPTFMEELAAELKRGAPAYMFNPGPTQDPTQDPTWLAHIEADEREYQAFEAPLAFDPKLPVRVRRGEKLDANPTFGGLTGRVHRVGAGYVVVYFPQRGASSVWHKDEIENAA